MNNGGPAFPQHGWSNDPETVKRMQAMQGMTLRDYFAGQVIAGLSALPDERSCPHERLADVENWRKELRAIDATQAYALADAMLAERNRGTT